MARYEYSAMIRSKRTGTESSFVCFGKTWKSALSSLLRRIGGRKHFDVIWVYDYQNDEKITETLKSRQYDEKFTFTIDLEGSTIINHELGKTIKLDEDDTAYLQGLLMRISSARSSDRIIESFTEGSWDDEDIADDDQRSNGSWQSRFNKD